MATVAPSLNGGPTVPAGAYTGLSPQSRLVPPHDSSRRQVSLFGATGTLVAHIIGGGVLAFPYAYSQAGIVLGGVLTVVAGILADLSLQLIVLTARATGQIEYYDIAAKLYGPVARIIVAALVCLASFLNLCLLTILIADLSAPVLEYAFGSAWTARGDWGLIEVKVVACVLVLPLHLCTSLHALRYLAIATASTALMLALMVLIRSSESLGAPSHSVAIAHQCGLSIVQAHTDRLLFITERWQSLLSALPIFVCAYMCHTNVLRLHAEFVMPTRNRVKRVIHSSLSIVMVIYLIVGSFGYLYAIERTCGNVLLNFRRDDSLAIMLRVCLAFISLGCMPLQLMPGRRALFYVIHHLPSSLACWCPSILSPRALATFSQQNDSAHHHNQQTDTLSSTGSPPELLRQPMIAGKGRSSDGEDGAMTVDIMEQTDLQQEGSPEPDGESPDREARRLSLERGGTIDVLDKVGWVHYVIGTVLYAGTATLVSIYVRSLSSILTLGGSTVAMTIAFVLPSGLYLRANWARQGGRAFKICSILFLVFAVPLGLLGTIEAIYKLSSPRCPVPSPLLQRHLTHMVHRQCRDTVLIPSVLRHF
ncbi:unnamed protein product [Vitrella brassicaformis CCMP3155]|uniref:Amino acid transporter transmembrane domain-containing protein n=1 Tax=Vitrella brassicaformis (strain CCMP3155) TaxID=1169540 RepID=A0A0G4F162_VITBC|nr:unnamed protein product [Vitrella brassicaformis CCMP3155]|mmetsp:Transcript_28431/g.71016  ORF Transcript_28431/g.71016 Transcript_28431/m.71016 type:complete len:592 (-) Transcript_28431:263-2038(-)|eukprot:CEM05622.1 unnamed protein product [Vitrella brassicaformis CCMP3155]